ncbi:MAG: hypothetical protein GKR92_13270 [Gammaproteobacteria bacterium]|nr:MAG: hypothetical protein GKR92_13270 [Gammaproteobacteria bacterium]
MSYLLNELLLYLLAAAAIGAAIGWFIRRCTCNRDLAELRSSLESKINTQATELENTKKQAINYKNQYGDIQSKYDRQSGDLILMTSRWQSTLKKAKLLPIHQTWVKNLQHKYQTTLSERNDFENLACQYVDMHADANQKIKRLNKHVTDQEPYKFRLDDMIVKVQNLNDKVTNSENDVRGLHGMIGQVQSKWRRDRVDTASMREIHPMLEQQASGAKAELHAFKNKSQTEITAVQKQRNKDLAEQNASNQAELQSLMKRIDELTPLETPSNDNKFNRFMDKVRLAGTSKNNVLGRTYKQINEIKLESSEKERVFVDTCEEKDAVIDDLREQIRTADNRALASSAAAVQEYKGKLATLESDLQTSRLDQSMLREHEHTIEAFKSKLNTKTIPTPKPTRPKPAKKKQSKASKPAAKRAAGLKAPAKGLKIAAAKVKDDLQVVKGIGPVMEGKLNAFGVYSYEQLGRLKAADIETLATTLGSFPDRINRDKWVSQSKRLYKQKYGQKID